MNDFLVWQGELFFDNFDIAPTVEGFVNQWLVSWFQLLTLFQIHPAVQGLLHPELTDIGASVAQAAIKVAELRL